MDTANPDPRPADPLAAEIVDREDVVSSPPASSGANKTALRIAWTVIGAGVLVAMSAAIAGGINPGANVLPIRNLAGGIMLVGLLIVLGAYRVAWLTKIWEKSLMSGHGDPQPARSRSEWRLPLAIVLLLVLAAAYFVVAAVTLVGGVVSAYALLLLRVMILAALVSLLVYSKGYLWTFCLGAILPVGLQAASWLGSVMFMMPPSAWRQRGLSDWEGNLTSLILLGFLSVACGTVAMIVRFLVESLPPARRNNE